MSILPVRQSASKEHFLMALGLNMSHSSDRQIFSTMWEEVTQYWVRHFETDSRHVLKEEYARNHGVRQPYKWGHLSRAAIDRAIDDIWNQASEKSRYYYDVGQSNEQIVHNWVLKWLLWHVARYRDERNNKKSRASEFSPLSSAFCSAYSSAFSSPRNNTTTLTIRERDPSNLEFHVPYVQRQDLCIHSLQHMPTQEIDIDIRGPELHGLFDGESKVLVRSPNTSNGIDSNGATPSPVQGPPSVGSPTIVSPTIFSPTVVSPTIVSPTVVSPTLVSPTIVSPIIGSSAFGSPPFGSPTFGSPAIVSSTTVSPTIGSPPIDGPAGPADPSTHGERPNRGYWQTVLNERPLTPQG